MYAYSAKIRKLNNLKLYGIGNLMI